MRILEQSSTKSCFLKQLTHVCDFLDVNVQVHAPPHRHVCICRSAEITHPWLGTQLKALSSEIGTALQLLAVVKSSNRSSLHSATAYI